ncbi:interferon-induced helicase C domain-containing protein 1 [Lampris incognitus]|uniref:interferon-induced helicase C domain-containing protein 1 n=1 Tax=Lampris incognitus TaxID=2546036 RepID=UPI0024B49689|nr:interferon-induced helicase C domain-containing protein 1 [Lampris incognitus]
MEMDDDAQVRLIEDFRPQLRKLIAIGPVLDHMHSLGTDQKELIRNKLQTEGNLRAADLLIDTVVRKPQPDGWFRDFVDALTAGGCEHAADYMDINPPSPNTEAKNDYCVRLIELLSPSLVAMNTAEVCLHSFSQGILTPEDREVVTAETEKSGNRNGARELLRRIVRCRPGWFSTFLNVLIVTEQPHLYHELTGAPPGDDKRGESDELSPLTTLSEKAENDVAAEEGPPNAEGPANPEEESLAGGEPEGIVDLYSGESAEPSPELNVSAHLQPDGSGTAAAAGGPKEADIVLRDYQMDVARPALEGKNIIVCLPTGKGKTRVAVYVTREHLDSRRSKGQSGKVVVLVNKVPLVEQHYSTEFLPFLKHKYKVERVSGHSQLKISFTEVVKRNDVIICTAEILQNYLKRSSSGDDEGIQLRDLTLMVIDECHHTQKGGVYNHIMTYYLKKKQANTTLKKEQKEPVPIPQILGLTASPGVGGATKMEKALDHILRICANLDACKIMTMAVSDTKKDLNKQVATAEDRKQDPFGNVIKNIMNAIHTHTDLSPTCDLGSQNYEQWVVQKERNAAKEGDQKVRVCAEHLRQYNEGLQLSNTIRMCDAFKFLDKYQEEEMKKKMAPEEEEPIQITDTERFLFNLFKDHKKELQKLATNPEYENNSLSKLRGKILHEFTSRQTARGIIFTKTRRIAIALSQWILENPKFEDVEVKAAYVIGAGDQSVVKPMTSAEQKDVLNKFRNGQVNLLIATTVAEEGLDIPDCNFVIRYGLSTNEISMVQALGRGRAEDSSYTLVEVEGSGVAEKEIVNEYRIDMMNKAIAKIKNMDQVEYDRRITEFQMQSILEEKVRMTKKKQKKMKNESPSKVKFSCRGCNKHVCSGEDIQIIEKMHRVNVTPQFRELFIERENTSLQERLLECEANGYIACKDCGLRWGSMMLYRAIDCPCLHIKNFVVTWDGKNISKYTKWSELPIQFPAFDYATHMVEGSEDEDTK